MAPPPSKTTKPINKVPPDGGYGWVIVGAFALNNIITIPIIQNFGLIFKDFFKDLGITGTDTSVIMSTNNAVGLMIGLFNGPLFRTFSYRKVAILASLLGFAGVALMSRATTFTEFLVCYGIITSAGCGLGMSSFSYALNSYFRKKRGVAMGIAMTITGLGPIFMPHVMSYLMREVGVRGTALILSGLSLQTLIASFLLRPVKWYLKDPEPEVKEDEKEDDVVTEKKALSEVEEQPEEEEKAVAEESDVLRPMLSRRVSAISQRSGNLHHSHTDLNGGGKGAGAGSVSGPAYWASIGSMHSVDIGSSMLALNAEIEGQEEEAAAAAKTKTASTNGANGNLAVKSDDKAAEAEANKEESERKEDEPQRPLLKRVFMAIVTFFDLNLLKDPVYVNLMLGMSLAVFAEINFSLLTPFILQDRGFDTQEIATLMSTIAIADIIFRFLAPFVKNMFKQPSRVMYLCSLMLLIGTRTTILFTYSDWAMMSVMVGLGVAKGLRTVYWVLVVPEYVPIERLPAASGIQSLANGILFFTFGPLLGWIRDNLGNYNYVIIAINVITFITVIMWSTEYLIRGLTRKARARARGRAENDVERAAKTAKA